MVIIYHIHYSSLLFICIQFSLSSLLTFELLIQITRKFESYYDD